MQKRLVTLALAMVLTPALALAQKVSYDYDKTASFAGKTYALKDGTKVGQQLIDDRIVAAIDTELAAKGLTKTESNPDMFVVYHGAFDKQKDISTYSSGYGGGYGAYGWGYGGGWGGTTTSTQSLPCSASPASTSHLERSGTTPLRFAKAKGSGPVSAPGSTSASALPRRARPGSSVRGSRGSGRPPPSPPRLRPRSG